MKLITEHIVFTLQIPNIGKKTAFKIFMLYDEKAIKSDSDLIAFLLSINKRSKISKVLKSIDINIIEGAIEVGKDILRKSKENNINIISFFDKDYPERLKLQIDRPLIINYKGDIKNLSSRKICIVGTRESLNNSNNNAFEISKFFGEKGINVVSGLAKGCDTFAHKGSLNTNGKTTAVLGCALNEIYPKENEYLVNEIIKNGGLLISEYLIGSKTLRSNFVVRDKLQSMISDCILVIQSKIDGGSMHTAKHAFKNGTLIAAIENEDYLFSGNIELIKNYNAIPVKRCDKDVLYKSFVDNLNKINLSKQVELF